MTPQQIADQKSIAAQKAFHRAELERLDALEKAQRPALAAGQVWRSPEWGASIVCAWDGASGSIYNIERQSLVHYANGLADCFVFLGLARDVLRVVPPDAVEQVAPVQDDPTGAELVGRLCWYRGGDVAGWAGPSRVVAYEAERAFLEPSRANCYRLPDIDGIPNYWSEAKLYREGVTP